MKRISMIKIFILSVAIFALWAGNSFSEISVYDANDQYLGVLFGDGEDPATGISVFVPQLGLPIWFLGQNEGNIAAGRIFFEADDCSGIPYMESSWASYQIIVASECYDGTYYTLTNKRKSFIPKSTLIWNYEGGVCECVKLSWTDIYDHVELSLFPKESFPFTLPVAMPLKFKYTSGGDVNADGKIGLEEAVNALQITSGLKNPGPPVGGAK